MAHLRGKQGCGRLWYCSSPQPPVSHRFMPGPAELVMAKAKALGEEGDLELCICLLPAPRTEYERLSEAEFEPRALPCARPKPRGHRGDAGAV